MSLIDTKLTHTLGTYLDLTAARHAAIANNIANLDTPGYKTLDTNFGEQLRSLLSGDGEKITTRVAEVGGLIERPDGNNVSLDREGYLLGQTQLQFQAGAALLRSQLRTIEMAIREGNAQ